MNPPAGHTWVSQSSTEHVYRGKIGVLVLGAGFGGGWISGV